MKYQIRKRENITLYLASKVAELDDSLFKNLEENAYTGETEEDFLKYISQLDFDDLPQDLDYDQVQELEKLRYDVELDEFHNSAIDFADSWFESGEKDEKYRKSGEFNASFSTRT